jgi:fructose-1-phosphate kinase PfkB-like protein
MPANTLCVGASPALQRVLSFHSLSIGEVNRVDSLSTYCGGKGQGAALAAQRWAPDERHAVAQFLGGDSGRYCEEALHAAGLETITQKVAGSTRICQTLLNEADGSNTELIDPSSAVSEDELDGLVTAIGARLSDFSVVAMCGTQPPGAETLYDQLAEALLQPTPSPSPERREPLLLLDGVKSVEGVLRSGRLDVRTGNVGEDGVWVWF